MFSCSQRSSKQKGSTSQCSWKGLCPGPSWAVVCSHRSCPISCCRGCSGHQALGFCAFHGSSNQCGRFLSCCEVFTSTFCCLAISRCVSGVRGTGLCHHSRAGHWEHRCVTPDFTGAGEQTGKHLHVPSPCKSVPIDNKLDPLWLQNELCHPNQRLKWSK